MDYGIQDNIWARVRVQIKRYLAVVRRIWWLLPLTISLGTCIAAWVVSQMPPAYRSTAQMICAGQYQLSNEGAVYNEQLSNYFGTQQQLMMSGQVRENALARVQTLHPELKPEDVDYKVVLLPQAAIFVLQVTARSAAYAQAYLDACIDAYIDVKKKLRDDTSQNTTIGLTKEMDHLNQTIDQDETEMLAFQRAHNVGYLETEGNDAAKYLNQLNQQLADLTSNYNLLDMLNLDQTLDRQQERASASTGTDSSDAKPDTALTSFGPIADYQRAVQQIAIYRAQLAEMSHRLKPKHPDIIDLNHKIEQQQDLIATLKQQSQEALKTHKEDLGLQIQNLKNEITAQEKKALDLSSQLAEFNRLKTKSDRAKTEYDRMLASFHSVDVEKTVDQDPLTVLARASEGVSVKPGLARIFLAGIGGGLVVGLLILFLIDKTDDRISSLMELQTNFPEHILGQIPKENMEGDEALLRSDDDRQALLESFRTLRSSLIFLPIEGKRPKTIVVTSALPDEGKTTVASNLAVTLAFSGARTLIVDADLRRGQVSRVFGATECKGFSNILLQKLAWREAVYSTSTDNLFILPCGPAVQHTSEHLLGKVTDQFILDIYDQFDYVIFDSPPVIILDDTLCLAPKIDATLFVLRFNTSSVRSSRRALELLHNRQVNVIGVVCNGVTISETEYNYNYNYRQYGNRYAEAKTNA